MDPLRLQVVEAGGLSHTQASRIFRALEDREQLQVGGWALLHAHARAHVRAYDATCHAVHEHW